MKKILVIEDDAVSSDMLTRFLQAKGYGTATARTGAEGVERFDEEQPDLALIDVHLPRKNGFEVCFDIKRTDHGRATPVLLMSAVYTDTEHAERYSAELRADGYLVKPFDLDALLERVRELIGQP